MIIYMTALSGEKFDDDTTKECVRLWDGHLFFA